jgi:hypothetical protein
MTPEERRADDDRFGNLSSAEQIRELKNLLAEVEAAIYEAQMQSTWVVKPRRSRVAVTNETSDPLLRIVWTFEPSLKRTAC